MKISTIVVYKEKEIMKKGLFKTHLYFFHKATSGIFTQNYLL